ncbi:putative adenosine monophosphate deaminase [Neospora caninum Liverpool]|uniref:AMP deaminase n=1 Tax=Neospora caninum (strain Liverpool) TaxID=572307 RepID=F0VKB6_NEOCL|nr:putative adenosine monophosphate deaminase [Neospora caninum Liverpool]CBZ54517.1 putative adenosine monophosphate deaminase [Neospora caninum Liverpool]CEL69230.1 TPA: adenosine monophosphate deaminase, putative [Neospora caninum Liverpool]|eukprot:XP_003884547.1 putative adenosine monophosphate deaminase [Neospora caninum Liverpool]
MSRTEVPTAAVAGCPSSSTSSGLAAETERKAASAADSSLSLLSADGETNASCLSRPSSAHLDPGKSRLVLRGGAHAPGIDEAEGVLSPSAFSAAASTASAGFEEDRRNARTQADARDDGEDAAEFLRKRQGNSLALPNQAGDEDEEQVGWSYMYKRLLSLNHKDAGAVTYMDKLPSVPAKAGSAAAVPHLTAAHAQPAGLAPPGALPFSPATATAVGYVRMVPSKDLAVASSVCDESVEAVRFWSTVHEEPPSPGVRALSEEEKVKFRTKEPMYDPLNIPLKDTCHAVYKMHHGVYQVFWDPANDAPSKETPPLLWKEHPIPDVLQFLRALKDVMTAVQNPACKSFCYKRLKYLEEKFNMHLMFNSPAEVTETKCNFHRDFYNVRKVDTHIHHSACMQQKHLLRFIRKKYRTEPDTIVAKTRDGGEQSLMELFHTEVGIGAHDASIDHLNVHALGSCFQRFDLFNQKYNPFGQKTLRDVFLKTDNYIEGRFLAEITREVISDLEERKYQHVEWRLSIYGRSRDEWTKLAKWVVTNQLYSKRVRWMVQVPRLYHVYRRLGMINNFGELLANIFEPLYDAVRNPKEHPEVFIFLHMLVGWDSVDDESYASKYTMEGGELPKPEDWTSENNPPYSYWGYYMYANIRALNQFMAARGLRALAFRPHCGEAGSVSHLATMFLLADAINHGIMLKKCPVLQYLFYLAQIGLAVSPLSNNALFMDIAKNPLYSFFKVGLNVSISTDDPLMFHFTDEPLLEEYSVAAHTWKLSPVDLCELARNSVLQSGYEDEFKRHWLGPKYKLGGRRGNCMRQTNVSNIRLQYREDALSEELSYMHDVLALRIALSRPFSPAMMPAPSTMSVSPRAPLLPATGSAATFEEILQPLEKAEARPGLGRSSELAPPAVDGGEKGTRQDAEKLRLGEKRAKEGENKREHGAGKEGQGDLEAGADVESRQGSTFSAAEREELHVSHSITISPPGASGVEREGDEKGRSGPRSPHSADGAGSPVSQGASPRMRPLLMRDAAMKKLLEVAEESAVMDLGELSGGGVSSSVPRSEAFEVLDGPCREALQTLDACTHLERREESVDVDLLKKVALTTQRSPSLLSGPFPTGVLGAPFLPASPVSRQRAASFNAGHAPPNALAAYAAPAASLRLPAGSGCGRPLRGSSIDADEERSRAGNVGLLHFLASPLLQQQLSHASSVIVGEYASSTAEGEDARDVEGCGADQEPAQNKPDDGEKAQEERT